MTNLILLRHGQSAWNLAHRFTGWADVDLTEVGETQARRAGMLIREHGIAIDRVFASVLTRVIRTANLALDEAEQSWVPMTKDWRLNERHYGALTGHTHTEEEAIHGKEKVRLWRRSYDIPPPPLELGGEYDFARDRRYAGITPPATESLKLTLERVLPYWESAIAPPLAAGETLMVVAHGNSLRAIIKHLFGVSDAAITGLEIPTGNPLVVNLDGTRVTSADYLDQMAASPLPALAA